MFGIEAADFAMMSGVALYLAIFALPFVQEDAAVIGAATASLAGAAPTSFIVAAVLTGLVASDAWKYWLGRLARRYEWAHKFAEKPGVAVAGKLICREFIQTMMTARFVPGTRIPTYVAAGFFKVNYPRYVVTLIITAAMYVGLMFALFHGAGEVVGEKATFWMPIVAIAVLLGYILFRWWNHRRKQEGVMTPLSEEQDAPGDADRARHSHEMQAPKTVCADDPALRERRRA